MWHVSFYLVVATYEQINFVQLGHLCGYVADQPVLLNLQDGQGLKITGFGRDATVKLFVFQYKVFHVCQLSHYSGNGVPYGVLI